MKRNIQHFTTSAQLKKPKNSHASKTSDSVPPVDKSFSNLYVTLNDASHYSVLLCSTTGSSSIISYGDHYVMMDYDCNKRALMPNKFRTLQKHTKTFCGNILPVLSCECRAERSHLITGLPSIIDETYDEVFKDEYADCLHVSALTKTIPFDELLLMNPQVDSTLDHNYSDESEKVNWFAIESSDRWCIDVGGSIGVVATTKQAIKCLNCQKSNCCHAREIKGLLQQDYPHHMSSSAVLKPKSCQVIPFVTYLRKEVYSRKLAPLKDKFCPEGHPWNAGEEEANEMLLFMESTITSHEVITLKCGECSAVKVYDGKEDGILHMPGYLVAHSVLREYLRQFATEGTSMHAFYKMWHWKMLDSGREDFPKCLTYNKFRNAWYGYLSLLTMPHDGFCCNLCGLQPEIVIMDGVGLTFRKCFLPVHLQLSTHPDHILRGSRHSERIFIHNQEARTLLQKFCREGLSGKDMDRLRALCQLHQPSLVYLTDQCIRDQTYKCPKIANTFIEALSTNSPVCALIKPSVIEICTKICTGKSLSVTELKQLQTSSPVVFELKDNFPEELKSVLLSATLIVQQTFDHSVHNLPAAEVSSPLSLLPMLKKYVERGRYEADRSYKEHKSCRKSPFVRGGNHTNGIFTLSCQHGVCYGVQVMADMESPNVPFTVLRTHFKKAPHVIVYDNACKLHVYCLNRDPAFFKDSLFVVDRLHWKNHSACSIAYCMTQYRHLSGVNSQVAEQRNSSLVKLKSMVSYMTLENYKAHVQAFIWFRNMLAKSRNAGETHCEIIPYFKKLSRFYTKNHS